LTRARALPRDNDRLSSKLQTLERRIAEKRSRRDATARLAAAISVSAIQPAMNDQEALGRP
jgi:hypothetical protein